MTTDIISLVICCLMQIENSTGQRDLVGDNGAAVGILQIHEVAVREANRIAGYERWTPADRYSAQESLAMCRLTLEYHRRRGVRDPVRLGCKCNRPYGPIVTDYRRKMAEQWARIEAERR